MKREEVRSYTLENLRLINDEWLYLYPKGKFSKLGNNFYCLFHTMEDQLCHYGQIRGMLKMLQDPEFNRDWLIN